jgi:PAS domain S-box-containing protein
VFLGFEPEVLVLTTLASRLLDEAPEAIVASTASGAVLFWNAAAKELLPAMAVGRSVEDAWRESGGQGELLARAPAAPGAATRSEGMLRRADGAEVPVEVSLQRLASPEHADPVLVARITRRREGGEPDVAALLDAAPDAMLIIGARGEIRRVNAQAEALFGYSRDELMGQSVELLVPERLRGMHAAHRHSYAGAPHVRRLDARLDLVARRKDGSELPVDISLSPVRAPEGPLVIAAIRDISARKATEAALRVLNDELQSFSYSVAHDLRAPLRWMDAFSRILSQEHGAGLDAQGRECVAKIQTGVARMDELIDGLLSLARVARAETRIAAVDLAALAREIARELSALEPERSVSLTAPETLMAELDPRLARTLLENLLGNAWKFTRSAVPARVEVGLVERDGEAVFFIRDNGAGFDMAHAEKLFAPFQRLHTVQEFPGMGIGLATAKRIVHRHGGRIWAEGRVGEGATFFFTLTPGVKGERDHP